MTYKKDHYCHIFQRSYMFLPLLRYLISDNHTDNCCLNVIYCNILFCIDNRFPHRLLPFQHYQHIADMDSFLMSNFFCSLAELHRPYLLPCKFLQNILCKPIYDDLLLPNFCLLNSPIGSLFLQVAFRRNTPHSLASKTATIPSAPTKISS